MVVHHVVASSVPTPAKNDRGNEITKPIMEAVGPIHARNVVGVTGFEPVTPSV
jgi:hypothetical protein